MKRVPKIGLALSGGGVRGLAHLGILDVMEGAQIPIQYIAGTSMGGIVAAVYAAGVPLDEVIAFCNRTGIMDFASRDGGWRGLFGHQKLAKLLADLLGDDEITFEDLRIPAAVVAADLETGETVVLDRGPLIPALLATSAFPIVFSPVRYMDRWLVDGGVLNNLPVDIVRQMGSDRVLAVSTPSSVTLPLEEPERPSPLSPRALFSFTNRTRDWKLPFLIAETSVGFTAQIVNQTRLELCPPDLLLKVNLSNIGVFATNRNAEVIEAGREVAIQHLEELVTLKTKPLLPPWLRRMSNVAYRLRHAWDMLQQPEYPRACRL